MTRKPARTLSTAHVQAVLQREHDTVADQLRTAQRGTESYTILRAERQCVRALAAALGLRLIIDARDERGAS